MGLTHALRSAAVILALAALGNPSVAVAKRHPHAPVVTELVTFAAPGCSGGCGSGSTIGPDGALYVTDGKVGRVLRVDTHTGAVSTFARGLPPSHPTPGIGGAIDVAFVGHTAYVLVTLVGTSFGEPDVLDGIYRVGRDGVATPIADIGAWSIAHPPATDFFVPSGVQYALEPYLGGYAVTDRRHNRVLWVGRDGTVRRSSRSVAGTLQAWPPKARGCCRAAGPSPATTSRVRGSRAIVSRRARGAPKRTLIVDVESVPGAAPALAPGRSGTASRSRQRRAHVAEHRHAGPGRPRRQPPPDRHPASAPDFVAFGRRAAFVVALGQVLRIDSI